MRTLDGEKIIKADCSQFVLIIFVMRVILKHLKI